MRRSACIAAFGLTLMLARAVSAHPQSSSPTPPPSTSPQPHRYAGMDRLAGELSAVTGSTLTLKGENGKPAQIVTTENTRFMKNRGPVRIADLHPGDGVMAVGNLDSATNTLHAAMVFVEDAAEVKAMRENLGKTYITGRVKSVDLDNARMVVDRADHTEQNIGFDESTSFHRAVRGNGGNGGAGGSGNGGEGLGRGTEGGNGFGGGGTGMGGMALSGAMDRAFNNGESITLADIKPGDFVSGTGGLKAGVFIPSRLLDVPAGMRRGHGGAVAPPDGAKGSPSANGQGAGQGPGGR